MYNKKGLSLVEVVVSLTILTFVLSGSLSLIIGVVNLSLEARTKTTVVTFAQSGLASIAAKASGGCLVEEVALTTPVQYPGDESITRVASVVDEGMINGLKGFKKATVTVTWHDRRGTEATYALSQLIRTAGY